MRPDEQLLIQEAESMTVRVGQMQSFDMRMPMVKAACLSPTANQAICRYIGDLRRGLDSKLRRYLFQVHGNQGRLTPAKLQSKLTAIKLRFVSALFSYDVFADVLTQRGEHENGVWLAGLDAVAEDALTLPKGFATPPVVCYLDRGLGAAIRRAHTPLPGRRSNPVAVIRIPRERMVAFGIASSLVHEVGHQAEMLMGLSKALKPLLFRKAATTSPNRREAMRCFADWITEILADAWGVSQLGITAPRGLMGVLSLPSAFLFRMTPGDPHPMPWIRVLLCLRLGNALYPDKQWSMFEQLWSNLYPIPDRMKPSDSIVSKLLMSLDPFVDTLLNFKAPTLNGTPLGDLLQKPNRHPHKLRSAFTNFQSNSSMIKTLSPTHALAMLGQAFVDHRITPKEDSQTIAQLLRQWAQMKNSCDPAGSPNKQHSAIRPCWGVVAIGRTGG